MFRKADTESFGKKQVHYNYANNSSEMMIICNQRNAKSN